MITTIFTPQAKAACGITAETTQAAKARLHERLGYKTPAQQVQLNRNEIDALRERSLRFYDERDQLLQEGKL